MTSAGIDAGAATTKAVVLDGGRIAAYRIIPTGFDFLKAAEAAFLGALEEANVARNGVDGVFATGYGKASVGFATGTLSEITAHAKGACHLFPDAEGIIDVGGQDSKAIRVRNGRVVEFLMNDRCAAGTGKFLEYTARAMEVPIEALGPLALASRNPARISSMCTVFAESEVISLRAKNVSREDIAAGLAAGIASRIAVMARRVGLGKRVVLVGGVAKNTGIKAALEKELGIPLLVPPEPQITGALGAALFRGK